MVPVRNMLKLTASLLTAWTLAGGSAFGQVVAPVNPVSSYPDPAAVLLPPVSVGSAKSSTSDLPEDITVRRQVAERPSAVLVPSSDTQPIPMDDYESTRQAIDRYAQEARNKRGPEPFEYLTAGRMRRDTAGKLVKNDLPRESRQVSDGWDKPPGLFPDQQPPLDHEKKGRWFKTDCDFKDWISPVTNPFLFEDPRSINELRMMALFQKLPGDTFPFGNGTTQFYGVQARLALTDRWSIMLNKLGGQAVHTDINNDFGLAEIHIGTKYAIIKNPETKTIVTVGGIFQIPTGSGSVYQNTGTLSIVPFVSAGHELHKTESGTLNGLATTGLSLSTNGARSDYFYLSGHLDYDIGNQGKYYPLIEMNWFTVTSNGNTNPGYGIEGRDIANFGANAKGNSLLTLAFGGRWKMNERWQLGGAYEFALFGSKDIFQRRFAVDLIWRY